MEIADLAPSECFTEKLDFSDIPMEPRQGADGNLLGFLESLAPKLVGPWQPGKPPGGPSENQGSQVFQGLSLRGSSPWGLPQSQGSILFAETFEMFGVFSTLE